MMKKVFTLLTLALLSIGSAWSQTTIGLTQTNDGTAVEQSGTTYKGTLAAAAYSGATNLTVAEAHGAGCGINQSARKTTGSDGDYWAAKCFRKTINSSTWNDTEWVGYSMAVASGYKISLTNVKATLWDANSSASYTWRVIIEDASGTALYTSGNKTSSTSSIGTLSVAEPTGVSNLTTGTYYVKLYLYQAGGNKYFTVPYLTVDAKVEEDTTPAYKITSSAGAGGTVSPSGETDVIENSNLSVTATANTGYAFASWTVDGVENASTANPYTFNSVSADHTIAAVFNAMYSVAFNVASENKGTSTVGPATQYANIENKWTAPQNYYTAKEGYTLTAWNDGENNYVPGTEYTLAGNITVAPVYSANTVTLGDFTVETTVSWPLSTDAGAPSLASEGNTQYYVQRATIAGNTVDIPIFVDTQTGAGISGKKGKFVSSAATCQVNAGTVYKIPAAKNMVVKYIFSQTTAVGNVGFTDDSSDLGGDGTTLTNPTVISSDKKTITYTYTGTADYLYMVDIAGGKYPTGISVTYPVKQTKYTAPTITIGDFSFADKAYPVTITASEGTLEVSTNGTDYTTETSPYQVNVTSTTHFYAKATGASYDDSDVADENVSFDFDGSKKYVAWVYESNYANAPSNYNIATDAIHTALATVYNVVNVDIKDYSSAITDAQKTALNGNLDDADLVVISEAVTGKSKGVIALKDLVGSVPMLSMKYFSYSSDRWAWGTPKNADKAVVSITPVSQLYKVLSGVTFTDGAIALFDYPNDQNHIQYVDSWSSEPTGDVVLATTSSKPAMHASTSQKYFGFGLSCDDFTKYNANAVTIVKNAAAMLIAGEDLDAIEPVTATINSTYGWATFTAPVPLDFTGITTVNAYIVTGHNDKAIEKTQMTGTVPANTPLLLEGETTDIPVAASSTTDVSDNLLKAGTGAAVAYEAGKTKYVLSDDGSGNAAFLKIVDGTPATVATDKAYLEFNAVISAPLLFFSFDSETTGIEGNVRETITNNRYYNLQGREVAHPSKGLYIMNGKKVMVK